MRVIKPFAVVAFFILLAGCAPGANDRVDTANVQGVIAGFWHGLWHGVIAPITFIISLFKSDVQIYEIHNNGGWYNLGFLFGINVPFGGHTARRSWRRGAAAVLGMMLLAPAAQAADFRGGSRVHIAAAEVVEQDLYAAGREVVIDGVVHGDVVAAGASVTVNGRVDGSVIAAGSTVHVGGAVGRAVRLAGGEVRVTGEVGTDIVAACGACTLGTAARVGADVVIGGGQVAIAGEVARGLKLAGEDVRIAARATGDAEVRAGALHVAPSASLASLTYGARSADISPDAHVASVTERSDWVPAKPSPVKGRFVAALVALVTGLIALWLWPERARQAAEIIAERPSASLLWGLVLAVLTPLVVVIGLVTVLASPLALMLAGVYGFGLYFGYLTGALCLGEILLKRRRTVARPAGAFALAIACLFVVGLLPVLGTLLHAVAALTGFGGLWLIVRRSRWFSRFTGSPVAA